MPRTCASWDRGRAWPGSRIEAFTIEHEGRKVKVAGLSGWRCGACDEVEFDVGSAKRYAAAGDKLVMDARERRRQEIRRIRGSSD